MSELNQESLIQNDTPVQGPEGLLFVGDAVRYLTPSQLETIGQIALLFGVEMRQLRNVERGLGDIALCSTEEESEPILLGCGDLNDWAAERGYSKSRTSRMVGAICHTASGGYADYDPHPEIARTGPDYNTDLRAVYARLARTQMSTRAWRIEGGRHPTKVNRPGFDGDSDL